MMQPTQKHLTATWPAITPDEETVKRVVKALDAAHCDIWIKLKPKALRSMALAVAQALSPPPLAPRTDLRFAIEEARRVLSETPELNMSNYNEDDVAAQNAGLIEVYKILDAAVAGEAA